MFLFPFLLLLGLSLERPLERTKIVAEKGVGLVGEAPVRVLEGVFECAHSIGENGDLVMENFGVGENETNAGGTAVSEDRGSTWERGVRKGRS